MTRLCAITLCSALGLLACGSNTSSGTSGAKSALDVAPGDNTVSGWTIDRANNQNSNGAPMTGATKADVEGLIDGAASPFYIAPYTPTMFAWQNYTHAATSAAPDGIAVSIYILQMPSVDQASGLYTAVLPLSEYARKANTPDDWKPTTPAVGEASRIQDDGSHWWINFHKGVFYVEIKLDPSAGPAPDYTPGNADTKAEAVKFAKAVADRM